MRLVRPTSKACDRARMYASLEVDGELAELERRLLSVHLERCPPCSAFAADVVALTDALRRAAREQLPRPVAVPSRAHGPAAFRSIQVGVAAAALALVGLGGVVGSGAEAERPGPSSTSPASLTTPIRYPSDAALVREQFLILQGDLPGGSGPNRAA